MNRYVEIIKADSEIALENVATEAQSLVDYIKKTRAQWYVKDAPRFQKLDLALRTLRVTRKRLRDVA